MISKTNAWQSYRQVAAQTASPGQLILMLYDGAIRFLELARNGFREEDPLLFNQTINNNIIKAQNIINELNATLNMEAGAEFAANMRRLYHYLDHRLHESNQFKREDGVTEAISRITVLRDAWQEMLQKQGQGNDASTMTSLAAVG